jgi:hypothetical protein
MSQASIFRGSISANVHSVILSAGESITAGKGLVNINGTVLHASSTNLKNNMPMFGIALNTTTVGNEVYVQTGGEVSSATLNLGDGYACAVGVDSNGILVRSTNSSCVSAPNWIGLCDANGIITISPRNLSIFDPKDYGCPMDGVSDDYPGFRILLDTLPQYPNHRGATIQIPRGEMWFSRDLHIDRPVRIVGAGGIGGGDQGNGTNINFAPGRGFVIDDYQTGANHNLGSGTTIEHLAIKSKQLIPANPVFGGLYFARTPSVTYALGDVVIPYNSSPTRANTKKCFRVTVSGTTASTPAYGTDPAGFSTAVTGTTIVDGTVTWTCEALPDDYVTGTKFYKTGDRVFVVGDTRVYWEAQNDGYTAGSASNPLEGFINPIGQSIVDGYVTWKQYTSAGILCLTGNCNFEHLYIDGFTGYAIFVQGDGAVFPLNISDFGYINNVHFFKCGGGITFKGFDAQGWHVTDCEGTITSVFSSMRTIKDTTVGAGTHGFYDASLGNTYTGCYYQGDGGVGFYVPVNTGSTFVGCRSESSYKDVIGSSNMFIASNGISGITGTGARIVGGLMSNILAADDTASVKIRSGGERQDGKTSLWFSNTAADYLQQYFNYYGWIYGGTATITGNGPTGTGWNSFGFEGPYNAGHRCVGISGPNADGYAGHWRLYSGQFIGTDPTGGSVYGYGTQYRGVDGPSLVWTQIRGGQRLVGDKFAVQSSGAPGTWDEYVVQVAGWRGHHWSPNSNYYGPGIFNGTLPQSIVEPTANARPIPAAGSKVFRAYSTTGNGASGSTEPNWDTAVNIGNQVIDNQVTWELVGFTPTYSRSQFIDDPVYALTPQSRKRWKDTAGTDGYTAAPKAKVDSYRLNVQTTTNAANQILFTTDILSDNSTSVINVTITGKQNGNFAEYVSAKLSGTYGRNNGSGATNIGVNDNVVKGTSNLGTSAFNLNVNGPIIEARVTPGVNATVDWGVFVEVLEGKS